MSVENNKMIIRMNTHAVYLQITQGSVLVNYSKV